MTREQISRAFELFGSVIPASTQDAERRRTAYFYRKEAIEWARLARQWWPGGAEMQRTCRDLAKHYLNIYRQRKTNNERTV